MGIQRRTKKNLFLAFYPKEEKNQEEPIPPILGGKSHTM